MGYQWDRHKAIANLAKHRVSFRDAVTVFADERAITTADPDATEERYVTIGMDAIGRVLVVIYCWRARDIRLISARRANRAERSRYENG